MIVFTQGLASCGEAMSLFHRRQPNVDKSVTRLAGRWFVCGMSFKLLEGKSIRLATK